MSGDHVTSIEVGGAAAYPVVVGVDLAIEAPRRLGGASRAAVLFASPLRALAARVADAIAASGASALPIEVPDAEAGKSIEVAARCWDALGAAGFTRDDVVIGVGGGAVTDLAGFVAACWLRGVRFVAAPTSLLGMVDAAIGGKTGVNTAAGKNLVGAFHPPSAVLCDLSTLSTLPLADLRSGLAEVIKCGFIADPAILDLIEAAPAAALDAAGPTLRALIERAVAAKARVVAQDLRESGLREILNYGHTLAHAIEKREKYAWRHGDAVSVGLVYAAEVGRLAGRLDPGVAARHRSVLASVGLPVAYDGAAWPALRAAMDIDKKTRGATLRFVVLDALAAPTILRGPDEESLRAAYRSVAR